MERGDLINWFWKKVSISGLDDCWEWTGKLDDKGYGASRTLYDHGMSQRASRSAYIFSHGEIENGLVVRHSCNNRKCCNPNHLVAGTQKDNMSDRVRSGNYASGENHPSSIMSDAVRRKIYSHPGTLRGIAKEFGLKSHATVSQIKRNPKWKG